MAEKLFTPHPNQFIFPVSESNFLTMNELCLPFRFGCRVYEMIVVVGETFLMQMVAKHGIADWFGFQTHIGAGLVEGDWVEGSEHADVGQNRGVVFAVAIAVRRHIDDERNVEVVASGNDGFGVFRHLGIQDAIGLVLCKVDGIEIAGTEATATAHAVFQIYLHLLGRFVKHEAVVGTFAQAAFAATAFLGLDDGLPVGMLVFLAGTRATAHADILNGAAETCHFVTFEVRQADEDIGIHDGAANQGFLGVFAAFDGHGNVICAFQAVANDDRATDGERCETVFPSTFKMFEGVLREPGYMVLQSVRKGFPPNSLTRSTMALA